MDLRTAVLAIALALPMAGTAGCYEGIDAADPGPTNDGDPPASGPDEPGPQRDPASPSSGCEELEDSPDVLRRLTRAQLLATIEGIFGVEVPLTLAAQIPRDAGTEDAFSNDRSALLVGTEHAVAYQRVAEHTAASAFADADAARELAGCDAAAAGCLEQFVARAGRLLYRRPLQDGEQQRVLGLAEGLADPTQPWAPFALAAEAMLQSPHFVFVVEPTDADGRLLPAALATKLALFLWGRTPTASLLDRAEQGALDDEDGLVATAAWMLNQQGSREGLGRLAGEWLHLDGIEGTQLDPTAFPEFDDELKADARAEIDAMLFDHLLQDRSVLDLLTTTQTMLSPALADLYGVLPPGTDGRVELPEGGDRAGLLGTAGVLALTSAGRHGNPVRRGLYVRAALMCDAPPPPPPDVEMGDEDDAQGDPVDVLDEHSSDPVCRACHEFLDPIGWGLDRYDAAGAARAVNGAGTPVREDGYVAGVDDGEFSGARELGQVLARTAQVPHCIVEKTVRWAVARAGGERIDCVVDDLAATFANDGFRYRDLVAELVRSGAFSHKSVVPGGQ